MGPGGLSDAELVALVLGSGMPGVNVLDSAGSLLRQTGGVTELMSMTVSELRSLAGVGVATAGRIVAVAELWRRANDPPPGDVLETPQHVVRAVRAFLAAERAGPVNGGAAPALVVVVADSELRLRQVVPLVGALVPVSAPASASAPMTMHALVAATLHEVLYRGGSAFALALVPGEHPEPTDELRAIRDVLKLASTTVGLRCLSTVVVAEDDWAPLA
ncbi:hypothetical protein B7R21_01695 [Subtercola boreus]|uniref:UPF0758 domain-containing protein n=1 Tax=Subtercola boreus TaxID=120213 RepID=A0A3E0W526_9MICO|nr:hypothetical protein B7R21_01695 [Subtercola boreus]